MSDVSLPSAAASADLPDVAPHAPALARQIRRLAALPEAPWLHGEVGRRLADKLVPIRIEPAHWVDWSAFLGAGAEAVAARYPEARRWIMEPHAALFERSLAAWQAGQSSPWWRRWRQASPPVSQADAPRPDGWPADGVQMVWANMTLHASADVPALLAHWHSLLDVGGFLMCSGLGPDTATELRGVYRALGWPLPTVDFIDMHDLGDELVQAGFQDPVMDMERLTLTWPDATAMLAELRTWGGNVAVGRHAGLRTPRWRERLLQALEAHCRRPDGRLGLTVELVYGHALKPLPRPKLAAETRVSLDDMKRMVRHGHDRT
ncbi:MAG: biotin synthase [Aquabacterium sp.]